MLGYLDTIANSASREIMTADQLLMFGDARTMVIALVAVSFLIVACQTALTQTAAVIERREFYIALDRIGMPAKELNRSRRVRVTMTANIAVTGSAIAAGVLAFWMVFMALVTAPSFVVAIVLVLVVGLALIQLGIASTQPVLARVLSAPAQGEER